MIYTDTMKRSTVVRGQGPRELMGYAGPKELADWELLAILIGSGGRGFDVASIAKSILKELDTNSYENITLEKLCEIPGVGMARGSSIMAAIEFGRRILMPAKRQIKTPQSLLPYIRHYADRPQEHFLSIHLNGAHEIIGVQVVSIGLVNRTLVHPREVFAEALKDRATAIIVAHNHPSGSVVASREDIAVTNHLKQAGELLDIPLLDHLIFTETEYYSFLEEGVL